jgi:hypothetical protein
MTVSGDVRGVVESVASKVSPQVLGILSLNILFILGLLWFMHDVQLERIEALKQIFITCTNAINKLPDIERHMEEQQRRSEQLNQRSQQAGTQPGNTEPDRPAPNARTVP